MGPILTAWLVELGIIAIRDLTQVHRLPFPSELLSSGIIFGSLGVLAESETAATVATTTAWGIVLATALATYSPGHGGAFDFLGAIGAFLAPGPNTGGPSASAPYAQTVPAPAGAGGIAHT